MPPGLRVTELVSLPQAAVRGDPKMILVKGKGGKERMVPLSAPARVAVADWLATLDAAGRGICARQESRCQRRCFRRKVRRAI